MMIYLKSKDLCYKKVLKLIDYYNHLYYLFMSIPVQFLFVLFQCNLIVILSSIFSKDPASAITSFKSTSPNSFPMTPRNICRMKAVHSKANETSQVRASFFHDNLHSCRVYGMIQDQIGHRQIQSLCFLFTLHKLFFHSLHLSWGVSYGRQISNDIFFCGCFRSFTENFHAWKICFLPLLLCRSIFKTISSCFDIKLSN